ncbi:hypothetical protein GJ496_010308 [Pomphorhynchus laevis]|nr:hypothetical protein GJ496_010308 [Pomphorhynchus laevis]
MWAPNLMHLPKCQVATDFVHIVAQLYGKAADNTDLIAVSLMKVTILSQTVLQRIPSSRTKDIRKTIELGLQLWKHDRLEELVNEALYFYRLRKQHDVTNKTKTWMREFTKIYKNGRISAAMRILEGKTAQAGTEYANSYAMCTPLIDFNQANDLTITHAIRKGIGAVREQMYEEELRELHDQTIGKWKHLL